MCESVWVTKRDHLGCGVVSHGLTDITQERLIRVAWKHVGHLGVM